MSKCLNPIELLRAMVNPLNPDNAAIIGHLYGCIHCRDELRKWRKALEHGEYEPQPDDDKAAEAIVKRVMEQEQANAWKCLLNRCSKFFSQFQDFSDICPKQVAFAAAGHGGKQMRKITTPPVFNFQSRSEVPRIYQWSADMTLPIHATKSSNITFTIRIPSLPEDMPTPQTLVFQGQELQIKNGSASISCTLFLTSAKSSNDEKIYVVFTDKNNNPYPAYGNLMNLTPFKR